MFFSGLTTRSRHERGTPVTTATEELLCLCLTSSLSPCAHPQRLPILRPVDGITQPDRSVRQHLASCLALAKRATATCSRSMPVCRNVEPILPRSSGTINMCSLAPICYASQMTQGRLHAARSTTCLSRISPFLSPSSSDSPSRPPGMRSQENRPTKTRSRGISRASQAPGPLSARWDANTRSNRFSAPICHGRLWHPVVQWRGQAHTELFQRGRTPPNTILGFFASPFQPSLRNHWWHPTRSTASRRRQRALLLHQWIAMPSLVPRANRWAGIRPAQLSWQPWHPGSGQLCEVSLTQSPHFFDCVPGPGL